jgi:hypothetical protein
MMRHIKDRVAISMAVVLVALIAVEATVVPHEYPAFPWHRVPGYAAMIGLFACIFVVLLSKKLGAWLLQRPERDDD